METTWVTWDRERQRDAEARLDAKAASVKARARAVRADEDESFEDDLHLPPWRRADLSTRCTEDVFRIQHVGSHDIVTIGKQPPPVTLLPRRPQHQVHTTSLP